MSEARRIRNMIEKDFCCFRILKKINASPRTGSATPAGSFPTATASLVIPFAHLATTSAELTFFMKYKIHRMVGAINKSHPFYMKYQSEMHTAISASQKSIINLVGAHTYYRPFKIDHVKIDTQLSNIYRQQFP
jgi:hypothetical protein